MFLFVAPPPAGVKGKCRRQDGSGRDADCSGDSTVSTRQSRQSGFLQSGTSIQFLTYNCSCCVCAVPSPGLSFLSRNPGLGSEEHNRDPGEEPSGRSDGGRAGGALLSSRLPGPRGAASVRPHRHRGVPGVDRGQACLQEAGVQQGAWVFAPATPVFPAVSLCPDYKDTARLFWFLFAV